jgi:hypothetical protein
VLQLLLNLILTVEQLGQPARNRVGDAGCNRRVLVDRLDRENIRILMFDFDVFSQISDGVAESGPR